MQFIILAFFFGFIILAIKGIFSFIIENSVFFGVCAVFIVSFVTDMTHKYTYKDYVNEKDLRGIVTGLIKFTENTLRSIEGVSGRVKSNGAILRYVELQGIINKFLYITYGKTTSETKADVKAHSVLIYKDNNESSNEAIEELFSAIEIS